MRNNTYIPIRTAERFIRDAFIRLGVPEEDSGICADVLLAADIQGIDTHGISRLKMYYDNIRGGIQFPQTHYKVVKETDTTATVDGGCGMGQVISYQAMKTAIRKAKQHGLGAVAVRNSSHFGIAGYYVDMAVRENMMGLAITNASPAIAPTFGVEPMLGTNPIAFGAPSNIGFPFVIDCATSLARRGKFDYLARIGQVIPEGWAINSNGNSYKDAKQLRKDINDRKAALLPLGGVGELLGGHKGYGLATMIEILSASLQGGCYLHDLLKPNQYGEHVLYRPGHFFLAINIESFIDVDLCKSITGAIMRELQNSKKMPGQSRIYVAGEKEYEKQKIRLEEGIPIDDNTRRDLKIIQEELALSGYDFLS